MQVKYAKALTEYLLSFLNNKGISLHKKKFVV